MNITSNLFTKLAICLWLIFQVFAISCSKTERKDKDVYINNVKKTQFNKTQFNAEKLIITKVHKTGVANWVNQVYDEIFEVKDRQTIDRFDTLLKKNLVQDYFNTIPEYSIAYYDKNYNYDVLRVSVRSDYDTVFVFDDHFQFYFKIHKRKWENLLIKSTRISNREIKLFDLNAARRILKYCTINNLPVVLNPDYQKNWPYFDGQFVFTVKRVGKAFGYDEIENNIKRNYPKDKYVLSYGSGSVCSCPNCEDCLHETSVTIICNKSFYTKFNLYKPKSFYDDYYADFNVLGSEIQLLQLDSILSKEPKR